MSEHALVEKAEEVRQAFSASISALADRRMQELAAEFRARYPKRRLEVRFGMGGDSVELDEYDLDFWEFQAYTAEHPYGGPKQWMVQLRSRTRNRNLPATGLWFIKQAIDDVRDITDGYSEGCPNDLIVEPSK